MQLDTSTASNTMRLFLLPGIPSLDLQIHLEAKTTTQIASHYKWASKPNITKHSGNLW